MMQQIVAGIIFGLALQLTPASAVGAENAASRVKTVKIKTSDDVLADIARQIGGALVEVKVEKAMPNRQATRASVAPYLLLSKVGDSQPLRFSIAAFAQKGSATLAPDVWFHISTAKAVAQNLSAQLGKIRPDSTASFVQNLKKFNALLEPVESKIQFLATTYRGTKVFATDFLYKNMLDDLGFKIRESEAVDQIATHGPNHIAAIKKLKSLINESSVGVLVYDMQSKNVNIKQLEQQAMEAGVPTIGVRETKPAALTYQAWMFRTLNTLQGGLNEAAQ